MPVTICQNWSEISLYVTKSGIWRVLCNKREREIFVKHWDTWYRCQQNMVKENTYLCLMKCFKKQKIEILKTKVLAVYRSKQTEQNYLSTLKNIYIESHWKSWMSIKQNKHSMAAEKWFSLFWLMGLFSTKQLILPN